MSIHRATREQLLAHFEAASLKAGHHPEYRAALYKTLRNASRRDIREAIERTNAEIKAEA